MESNLEYITESDARHLIETEVSANLNKGFIIDTTGGFANHCMDTGRLAYCLARDIIKAHPSLKYKIDPEIVKVAGYMHDFAKIYEGNPYHEIGTAYLILMQGEQLKIVSGGRLIDRENALLEIASLIPPDFVLYEELGGVNYPEKSAYDITKLSDRLQYIRKRFSKVSAPISIEELALPYTLNQQISLVADLSNVNGSLVSVEERLVDIIKRYSNADSPYYNPLAAKLIELARPRLLIVESTIKELL